MDSIFNDAVREIVPRYIKCIAKAANDFIEGKKVDCDSLAALHDSIRVLHNLKKSLRVKSSLRNKALA